MASSSSRLRQRRCPSAELGADGVGSGRAWPAAPDGIAEAYGRFLSHARHAWLAALWTFTKAAPPYRVKLKCGCSHDVNNPKSVISIATAPVEARGERSPWGRSELFNIPCGSKEAK